ncbi:unnamed protein product [Leptidea sinapis]|uniref:Ubiquitin-like protease family profile domain-containing protein n=1 Tax=Leptidea sinapis TaxID=189913 RepID=A0A5E4QQN9_9NEOP|nr:unnamed protein product [Leptidea sinapis]
MAQYYQIVGQGHSLTLEDLQRFCPNICLDGRIVVNQEDPQYASQQVVVQQSDQPNDIIVSEGVPAQPQIVVGDGLQYQHQYIIRNDQPSSSLPPPPQPPPPPPTIRPGFQQQQQQPQQNHQQQTLHRHQVFYTSELPVDAQTMLQQSPQSIDASMMQQSSPQNGTPTRSVPPRLLNQALTAPAGVTLVRTPVRTVRPRRPPMRAALNTTQPLQVPRLLTHNQLQQGQVSASSSGVVGASMSPAIVAAAVRNRVPRAASPRTPSPRVLNTHAGTIVTQNMSQANLSHQNVAQTSQNNITLPQPNTINVQQNMSSQQLQQIQQVKKVVVQPNNANEMDDLEESITAAIVQKNIVTDNVNKQQYQSLSPVRQGTVAPRPTNSGIQVNFNPQQNFQQQHVTFENQHIQPQHQPHAVSQISQLLMQPENPEEKRQVITLDTGRQTLVKSKEQQRPVQRVPPMQTNQQTGLPDNNEAVSGPSEQSSEPQSAKMLIFLQNGEQRLITFTLPKESCTLQEVLEQVEVPFTEDTHIQCMQNTNSEIDYFVSIGSTTRIEEMLENHPILVGDMNTRNSPSVMSQPSRSSEVPSPEKTPCPDSITNSPESPRSPPPRFVEGMLAMSEGIYRGAERSCEGIKLNLLKNTIKSLNSKTGAHDKKPARVRKPRGKQPDPEPEQSASMKEPSLSEIEGGTPDSGIGFDQLDDESREEINHGIAGMVTSLNCRTIRIGSYRYTPKEKIYLSSRGIKIVAPSLKNESQEVALQIQLKEIVRVLGHFGKGLPVIFLYTMSKCGAYIRKTLDMVEDAGPYYDPMSKVDPYKRITLLPEVLTDEAKVALKTLFGKVLDELNPKEANEILVRTCPKEINNVSKMTTRSASITASSGSKNSNPAEIRQILIYPPGKGGIPINTEDYMCLAQDQFLNDVIIDFYLKHLVHDVLTHAQREKTHIFSTFFYKRLTTKPSKINRSSNPHEWDSSLTPAQKRHARVKTWTKNVNIFDKDFIESDLDMQCDSEEDEPEKPEIKLEPVSKNKIFNKDNIKGSCPKIPQQNNFTDCGLYLLQYVEQFFKSPITDYTLPIKQLSNWFDEIVVTRKREEISNLLKLLMHKYNPDSHLALPDIAFPTLNGKLVESDQQEESGDSEKSGSSKELKAERISEGPTLNFLVKRNIADSSETIHLRKTIRLTSDLENRSVMQIKQEFIKKGDNENQILIPIKVHSSDLIHNNILVNKSKALSDKKHGVYNHSVSSVNCVRQNVSDSDTSFLKTRRINKLDDIVTEGSKKFKKNDC